MSFPFAESFISTPIKLVRAFWVLFGFGVVVGFVVGFWFSFVWVLFGLALVFFCLGFVCFGFGLVCLGCGGFSSPLFNLLKVKMP